MSERTAIHSRSTTALETTIGRAFKRARVQPEIDSNLLTVNVTPPEPSASTETIINDNDENFCINFLRATSLAFQNAF